MAGADAYAHWLIEQAASGPGAENRAPTLSATAFYAPVQEVSWNIPPQLDDRSDELRGIADNIVQDVVGFDATDIGVKMRLYPNFFGILMTLLHGAPTTTPGDGVITDPDAGTIPAGAYRHVWTSGTANTAVRTAQLQLAYTDQTVYYKIKGVSCDSLSINMNGDVAAMAATLKGLYPARIANPSLTAAYDAATIKPFIRRDHTITTWLASSGATTNAVALDYAFQNPLEIVKTLSGSRYPDNFDRTGANLQLTGNLVLRDVTTADFDAFVASPGATNWTAKTKLQSAQNITGSYKYAMWFQGNCAPVGTTVDPLAHRVRLGMAIPVEFGYDAGVGYGYKVTVVNSVSSYTSVG